MLIRKLRATPFALVALFVASTAQAGVYGSLTASYAGQTNLVGTSLGVTVRSLADPNVVVQQTTLASGGQFQWDIIGTPTLISPVTGIVDPAPLNPQIDMLTFCLELTEGIPHGTITFDIVDLKDAPDGGAPPPDGTFADNNTGPYMGPQAAAWIKELWTRYYGSVVDQLTAGAFQLAIWKFEYDHANLSDGMNFQTANFHSGYLQTLSITKPMVALSATWINDILNNDYAQANLVGLTSIYAQDQILEVSTTIPEPFSLAVWSVLGLVGIGYGRRRRSG